MKHMTIVVAGGSGFIGTSLTRTLLDLGHTVIVVDLRGPRFTHERLFFISCDLSQSVLPFNVLERTDAIINLCGASIATKWTPQAKARIRASRVDATEHLVESIKGTLARPSVLVNASAVGYYGETDEDATEQTAKGEGFLADIASEWEAAARKASEHGLRVVTMRNSLVLGRGGFLHALTSVARFGFLASITRKDFWLSWIHEKDLVNAYLFALETTTLQGAVNVAAPHPVRYKAFMKALGAVLKRKIVLRIPSFILRWKLGEGYTELVRNCKVTPQRLVDKGFHFSYESLESALDAIYSKKR